NGHQYWEVVRTRTYDCIDSDAGHGNNVLIANLHLSHLSLLRKTLLDTDAINKADGVDADIAPARPDDPPARHAPSAPSVREDAFAHPFRPAHISAVVRDRGVGL